MTILNISHKISEVETLLSRIEQDILSDTLPKKYNSNISRAEKQALNKWRDNLNKKGNEFLLRIQDKENRFIFVDKKTNKERANEQIRKSNFKKIHFDPPSLHIQKVKQFSKK